MDNDFRQTDGGHKDEDEGTEPSEDTGGRQSLLYQWLVETKNEKEGRKRTADAAYIPKASMTAMSM